VLDSTQILCEFATDTSLATIYLFANSNVIGHFTLLNRIVTLAFGFVLPVSLYEFLGFEPHTMYECAILSS
jgi:hypothetical protein